MKKLILLALIAFVTAFQFCSSSKKAAAGTKVTYNRNVYPLMQANCTPCHFPPQGRAKALNTFGAAKENIDEILARVKRNPEDKGFMPLRHPKLPDSTIAVFERWKASGLAE